MPALKKLLLILSASCLAVGSFAQPRYGDLVPLPVEQRMGEGEFVLNAATYVAAVPGDAQLCEYFFDRITLSALAPIWDNTVTLVIDATLELPAEGYAIEIGRENIEITGKDRAGVCYGIETLAQLATIGGRGEPVAAPIPCQTIIDYPRFAYRGMSLDVARTFSDKQTVMRFIDNMARHKFNRLHWHLVDDEGWRIEIEGLPRLTSVGGFRGGDSPLKPVHGSGKARYGGYYTRDDIREVVNYAASRNIEIIPEIDLPGHSRAAAKAYPQILCDHPGPKPAAGDDERHVWCVTKESNYELLDTILQEVAALFPGDYIHVGGDEVDPKQWESCPGCGSIIKEHSAEYLNGMFMTRLNEILAKHGKRQAVWNEAMNGGNLPADVVVHGWENVEACIKSLSEGYRTVVMPSQYFYFDMKQSPSEPGYKWAGIIDARRVYSFELEAVGITPSLLRNVVGIEGALWTELMYANGPGYLDYQTYPRMCALAEVAWTQQELRNWEDFKRRLDASHLGRLGGWGIGYRKAPEKK